MRFISRIRADRIDRSGDSRIDNIDLCRRTFGIQSRAVRRIVDVRDRSDAADLRRDDSPHAVVARIFNVERTVLNGQGRACPFDDRRRSDIRGEGVSAQVENGRVAAACPGAECCRARFGCGIQRERRAAIGGAFRQRNGIPFRRRNRRCKGDICIAVRRFIAGRADLVAGSRRIVSPNEGIAVLFVSAHDAVSTFASRRSQCGLFVIDDGVGIAEHVAIAENDARGVLAVIVGIRPHDADIRPCGINVRRKRGVRDLDVGCACDRDADLAEIADVDAVDRDFIRTVQVEPVARAVRIDDDVFDHAISDFGAV